MEEFKRNHYVPKWYQYQYIPGDVTESKFYYLDLNPESINSNGHKYKRKDTLKWGPKSCFCQDDLYTTKFGEWESTEIEQKFFGNIDSYGRRSVEYLRDFEHLNWDKQIFKNLVQYMSIQKLRTPKGLGYLSKLVEPTNKNGLLFKMQELQQIFCRTWMEAIWSIADASNSPTKFILTDHPVTIYNQGCFPASKWCKGCNEPDVLFSGSHALFPLSLDKILILTNLSWMRNPYGCPRIERPNPTRFGDALFDFRQIQVGRTLAESEVLKMNYILKRRAYKFIAAAKEEWLYPEKKLESTKWDQFGKEYLLMPDPREVEFTTGTFIKFNNGAVMAIDEYGRTPGQPGYNDENRRRKENVSFRKFQDEFDNKFDQRDRGRPFRS